ncbi:hypothetical protein ACJJTC_007846 [Scirpophaga incertulas]
MSTISSSLLSSNKEDRSRETWKALCMCLAGVCQNCTDNQTYCSHLVPLCVKKCQQGDIEVMVTLNSLINNHSRNMKLFLECNGLSIFDKEILQHDSYMELLDVVVQTITLEMLVALYKTVIRQLRYIEAEFGLDSRVRQWATVILHHFNTRLKEFNINEYKNKIDLNETKAANQVIQRPNYDETKKLLQNVIKEIYQYNANCDEIIPLTNEKVSNVQNDNISNYDSRKGVINSCRNPREAISRNGTVKLVKEKSFENSMKELSFSFLSQSQWDTKYQNTNLSNCNNEQRPNQLVSNQNFKDNIAINNTKISSTNIPGQHSKYDNSDTIKCEPSTTNVFHFKPTFVSTPKHSKYRHENFSIKKPTQMSRINRSTFKKLSRQNFKTKRYQHNSTKETKEHDSMKNRSLSVRLFDVINDSCTTFVKTVTKIFRSKEVTNKQAAPTAATKIDPSCNNSFTDYMRRRDAALLEKQTTKSIDETNNINSCKTCNDTLLLKRKIMDDDYLKETVKKLKMGIYVYGCDFKKISRTIWPNESYMTPEMLYNLYRKVILK